jgi:hypothetical protein
MTSDAVRNAHSSQSGIARVTPSSVSAVRDMALAAQWMAHTTDTVIPAASSHPPRRFELLNIGGRIISSEAAKEKTCDNDNR